MKKTLRTLIYCIALQGFFLSSGYAADMQSLTQTSDVLSVITDDTVCGLSCHRTKSGPTGATGPRGATGATGATGTTGATGAASSAVSFGQYASYFERAVASNPSNVLFDVQNILEGITYSTGVFTITEAGTYSISAASPVSQLLIIVNGVPVGTTSSLAQTTTLFLDLLADDKVSVFHTGAFTAATAPEYNAYITIQQIN